MNSKRRWHVQIAIINNNGTWTAKKKTITEDDLPNPPDGEIGEIETMSMIYEALLVMETEDFAIRKVREHE